MFLRASLRLFSDAPFGEPTPLFGRDLHARGIGFITRERLPLGYGGTVEFPSAKGETVTVHCTVLRCREAVNGWFEGALQFTREHAIQIV